jgi:DNA-directed RNA polymerase specialized sigma24 family protein
METIAKIVSTLSPSQRWLWRRVELDGASLRELAVETNMTANDLNRALYYVRRAIRRALDAEGGEVTLGGGDRETGRDGQP